MVKIFGNYKVQKILSQAVENRQFGRAYLLQGPSGVGKREMAKNFAAHLLGNGNFSLAHPDLFILDGKGEMAEVAGIKNIRQMRDKIILSCQKSKVKVVLGLDIDVMKKESLNALLKSLEEPLPDVVFALTASSETLKTIESRCSVLMCRPLAYQELVDMGKDFGIPQNDLDDILSICVGKPGLLVSLANQNYKNYNFIRLSDIMDADIATRFDFADKFSKELDKIQIMLYNWIGEGRKNLAKSNGRNDLLKAHNILKELLNAFEEVKQPGANCKLILENLFLSL